LFSGNPARRRAVYDVAALSSQLKGAPSLAQAGRAGCKPGVSSLKLPEIPLFAAALDVEWRPFRAVKPPRCGATARTDAACAVTRPAGLSDLRWLPRQAITVHSANAPASPGRSPRGVER
jgi:hypothetical protein